MTTASGCRRCDHEEMKTWAQLTHEEREVVNRLPGSAKYTREERRLRHEWCTRCWNEQTMEPRDV